MTFNTNQHQQPKSRLRKIGCTLLALAGVWFTYTIFRPALLSAKISADRYTCEGNMQALAQSIMMYVQDWDEHYPPAERWRDLVLTSKYVTKKYPDPKCPEAKSPYSYGFNANMVGRSLSEIDHPNTKILLFEMEAQTPNAIGGASNLPVPPRHNSNVFVHADGQAAWQLNLQSPDW